MDFRLIDQVPLPPSQGRLFAAERSYDGLYFPNGQSRTLPTGVGVVVPQGQTLVIEGLYDNEKRGLSVVRQQIHGPAETVVFVTLWNNSPATIKLEHLDPIAAVTAVKTPTVLPWRDMTDEAAA